MTPEQRIARQAKLARHSAWLEAHPWQARAIALWFTLAILCLAEGLRYALDRLSR